MFILSSVYKRIVAVGDKTVPLKFKPLWEHPAGPKTVHFWAPICKWALVAAGLGDLQRPAEKLSISQNSALAATGTIWARYSLVIIPKNMSLFTVNLFVALTGYYSLARAANYKYYTKPALEAEKAKKKSA